MGVGMPAAVPSWATGLVLRFCLPRARTAPGRAVMRSQAPTFEGYNLDCQ